MSYHPARKFKLQCSDNKIVEINWDCIENYIFSLKEMLGTQLEVGLELNTDTDDEVIPVDVSSYFMSEIVKYCQHHQNLPTPESTSPADPTLIEEWDQTFLQKFLNRKKRHQDLLELYKIAHYLDIPTIRTLVAKQLANMMHQAKNSKQIKELFGLN